MSRVVGDAVVIKPLYNIDGYSGLAWHIALGELVSMDKLLAKNAESYQPMALDEYM